jgi:two-component system sensor histidine kinase AlgZ
VEQDRADWLPDFCAAPTVVSLWILAAAVLIVVQLAPPGVDEPPLSGLPVGMLLLFSTTTVAIVALCALRRRLSILPSYVAVAASYVVVLGTAAFGSFVSYWIDHALMLGATVGPGRASEFMARNIMVCAIVWGIALRHFYVRGQWQRQVRAHAAAQFDALQARIRPHFLFNSMNTIASLIPHRPNDAEKAVEDLSELFRVALQAGATSTLGAELALTRRYVDIERLRLGSRLDWHERTGDVPLDLKMPALLVQPLVENAILHGIQGLEAGGVVDLHITRDGKFVTISVRNPIPAIPAKTHRGSGTALNNIRQRLKHHFGDLARLEIERTGDQFLARLVLPCP